MKLAQKINELIPEKAFFDNNPEILGKKHNQLESWEVLSVQEMNKRAIEYMKKHPQKAKKFKAAKGYRQDRERKTGPHRRSGKQNGWF